MDDLAIDLFGLLATDGSIEELPDGYVVDDNPDPLWQPCLSRSKKEFKLVAVQRTLIGNDVRKHSIGGWYPIVRQRNGRASTKRSKAA